MAPPNETNSALLSNLRILNIVPPETVVLTLQLISSESTLHALFHALSPDDAAKVSLDLITDNRHFPVAGRSLIHY